MIIGTKYEVIEEVGRGGMGVVYKVRHLELNASFALKMLIPEFAGDAHLVGRFHHEARIMAQLNHHNIVRVFDIDRDEDFFYFVMEYISGKNLAQIIRENGPLPLAEVIRISKQVGQALTHAHAFKPPIVHRDIKPSNIMIEEGSGKVVLTDFGIAKLVDQDRTRHTVTGKVVGTIRYSSPEQLRGCADIDARTDIYSFGLVMYEMCTGHAFFKGVTDEAVIGHLLYDRRDNIPVFEEEVPFYLRRAVTKSIAKDRALRYVSVISMLAELDPSSNTVETQVAITSRQSLGLSVKFAVAIVSISILLMMYFITNLPLDEHSASSEDAQTKKTISSITSKASHKFEGNGTQEPESGGVRYGRSLDTEASKENIADIAHKEHEGDGLASGITAQIPSPEPHEETGTLDVMSQPLGAEVWIEGKLTGTTPLHVPELVPGRHLVKASSEGYETAQETVEVHAGKFSKVSLILEKIVLTGKIKIESAPAGARWYLDGSYAGTTPGGMESVALGVHRIEIIKPGFQSWSKTLEIEAAHTTRLIASLSADRSRHALVVNSQPEDAQVRILNIKPKYYPGIRLNPGHYHIEIRKKGFVEHRQWIKLVDTDRILSVNLDPVTPPVETKHTSSESTFASVESSVTPVRDHEAISQLLYRFKLAYESKDLTTLQEMALISVDRRRFLEQLFRDYRTVEVSISGYSMTSQKDLASARVRIDKLIDNNGDHIIPAGPWMQEKIVVRKKGGQWGKIEW